MVTRWRIEDTDRQIQDDFLKHEPEMQRKMLDAYAARLETDFNRLALARVAEAGYDGVLVFSVEVEHAKRTIRLIPNDAELFRKLEFGEFDDEGNLKTPAYSVVQLVKVTIRLK